MVATPIRALMGVAPGPVVPTPTTAAMFTLTSSPDGGWPSIMDAAMYYNGNTYFGYTDGGNIAIRSVVNATQSVSSETILAAAADWLEDDWHDAPSVLVRSSDHKILTAYCRHAIDAHMYMRVSSSAEDISTFASATDIAGSLGIGEATYPQLHELTAEGKIYLFWRSYDGSSHATLYMSTSSDNGATWAAKTAVYSQNAEAYWRIVSNGVDRIDIATTNGVASGDAANVYHFYYDGSWHKSDGTGITLPLGTANLTQIYSGATHGAHYTASIARVGTEIAVTFPVYNGADEDYIYARWNGSAWSTHTIVSAVNGGDSPPWGEGGHCVDPTNLDRVIAVVATGGDYRLFEYTTTDDGATWSSAQLTTSGADDVYPVFVRNWASGVQFVALKGTAVSYTNFSFGAEAYG